MGMMFESKDSSHTPKIRFVWKKERNTKQILEYTQIQEKKKAKKAKQINPKKTISPAVVVVQSEESCKEGHVIILMN